MIVRYMILVCWVCAVSIRPSVLNANTVDDTSTTVSHQSLSHEQLQTLAQSGSASAQYELGLTFEFGRGVTQDDTIAVYWYEKSAAQYFPDALYRLAILYDNGWGLVSNKEKALNLYKTAAEKGHVLAQHDVAIMYFQGSGTSRNLVQACKWIKIAVASGNPLMQKHLKLVEKEMSQQEIKLAEVMAEEWLVKFKP